MGRTLVYKSTVVGSPFESYPGQGRALLGKCSGANCRREYGLKFMRRTGQRHCAYCGTDLTSTYDRWLSMAIDHVVPVSVCRRLNIPSEWAEDCVNKVLACGACNSFENRFSALELVDCPTDLETFIAIRDRLFIQRKLLIARKHVAEREFFDGSPWVSQQDSDREVRGSKQAP